MMEHVVHHDGACCAAGFLYGAKKLGASQRFENAMAALHCEACNPTNAELNAERLEVAERNASREHRACAALLGFCLDRSPANNTGIRFYRLPGRRVRVCIREEWGKGTGIHSSAAGARRAHAILMSRGDWSPRSHHDDAHAHRVASAAHGQRVPGTLRDVEEVLREESGPSCCSSCLFPASLSRVEVAL